MIAPTLVGMVGVALLATAWVAVQLAWARSFPTDEGEPDVLARRGGCTDCSRSDACATLSNEEERS